MSITLRLCLLMISVFVLDGCRPKDPGNMPVGPGTTANPYGNAYGPYGEIDDSKIEFLDEAASNTSLESDLTQLTFTDKEGKQVALKDFLGQKHVVLVITRGYSGAICPYCATQTSRLIANYSKLQAENAEVLVVYPLSKPADVPHLDEFVGKVVKKLPEAESKVPFPLLLDVELKAVDELGIRRDLSKPATYIFDKEGQLRYAYVGATLADRPSIKAMLDQLSKLNQSPAS